MSVDVLSPECLLVQSCRFAAGRQYGRSWGVESGVKQTSKDIA
jgi:hypothetical protein